MSERESFGVHVVWPHTYALTRYIRNDVEKQCVMLSWDAWPRVEEQSKDCILPRRPAFMHAKPQKRVSR